MHTKSELEGMSLHELEELAVTLGLKPSKTVDPMTLIYDIIDEESMQSSLDASERAPKKRGRKPKAEKVATSAEPQVSAEETVPKKRGRKPKAEKEVAAKAPQSKGTGESVQEVTAQKPEPVETVHAPKQEEKSNKDIPAAKKTRKQFDPATFFSDKSTPDFIIMQDVPDVMESRGCHNVDIDEESRMLDDMFGPLEKRGATQSPPKPTVAEHESYDFDEAITGSGVLEICNEGYGYLRSSDYNYMPAPDDIYITVQQIRQWGLKTGDVLEGPIRLPRDNERFFTMSRIERINGRRPNEIRDRVAFEHLTPLFPDEKFTLCGDNDASLSVRVVDLFAPIGKGQRALLVAQPKTGKTILLKDVANAIAANHPEAYLMVLLIDERPEEVTDMARTVNAEVIASTFDEPAEHHVHVANLVIEKAKRLVESGHDVVIFLDSITRLARAYNTVAPASGKILSGGVDANSLQKPKRFFGAARNIEGGGSLTIIATALIDTGSKMDEVIFEEFKGTGNMELQLDRQLANKRIFPAVNIIASSTRRDDLLQNKLTLDRMWILRKMIADMTPTEAMTFVKERLENTRNNEEFLMAMGK